MTTARCSAVTIAALALATLAGCAPTPDMCLAWRQTGSCSGRGPREPENDRACDATILSGWSGYCECTGGRVYADCGHVVFDCDVACRAAFGGGGGGDTCSSATSCEQCTPRAGCGWCNGRCVRGTSSGSGDGVCSGSSWSWTSDQCRDAGGGGSSDPCASSTTCGACTPRAGCGFCGASGRCMSGGASGPSAGTCGGGWSWLPSEC